MTSRRTQLVRECLSVVIDAHYDDAELTLDVPLPLELGPDWQDILGSEIEAALARATSPATVSNALAEIAYDSCRALHKSLCTSDRAVCGVDVKAASDLVSVLARLFLRNHMSHGLLQHAAAYLDEPFLAREEAIRKLDTTIRLLLRPVGDESSPIEISSTTPMIQINTAISRIGDDDYLALRRAAMAVQEEVHGAGLLCEVTSDFATPATRVGLVDEARVRARIYRCSGLVIFSRFAGDGTSTTWTIGEELGIPTLVLRDVDDDGPAARFPGQLACRWVVPCADLVQARDAVCEFLSANRARIEARARLLYEYSRVSTQYLISRLDVLDPAAFDGSTVTWERARFHVSSPINWFQSLTSTQQEILRVTGLPAPVLLAGGSTPGWEQRHLVGPGRVRSTEHRSRTQSWKGEGAGPARGVERRNLTVDSVRALLQFAETRDVSFEQLDRLVTAWQSPQLRLSVSRLDRSPSFETWQDLFGRLDS